MYWLAKSDRRDFNPRSPRGERPGCNRNQPGGACISTLAPLAGSDGLRRRVKSSNSNFNPRSPRGERRCRRRSLRGSFRFQPSLPSRGATLEDAKKARLEAISTLAPLAGSDPPLCLQYRHRAISTLAPLAGSDLVELLLIKLPGDFNPRSPRGERRQLLKPGGPPFLISTLAPLAGSD